MAALNDGDWAGQDPGRAGQRLTTQWTYRDVIEVVEGAGAEPRRHHAAQGADRRRRCGWLDLLLTQIEKTMGLEVGRIGIEAQIENAAGLIEVDAIAAASPRVETDHLRPGRLHGHRST